MGLFYRPLKNSRQPERGEKTRRNFPLEFRLHGNSDVRRWVRSLGLASSEKIEVPSERDACAGNDCERLEAGVLRLDAGAILAVLDDGVVQLQLLFGRYDIIRP